MHNQTISYIVALIAFVIALHLILSFAASKDAIMLDIGSCVSEKADQYGFNGSHREEWELFSSECI